MEEVVVLGYGSESPPARVAQAAGDCRPTNLRLRSKMRLLQAIMVELELELIQPHMAQKPVLRGEVGYACVAREVACPNTRWILERNMPGDSLGDLSS